MKSFSSSKSILALMLCGAAVIAPAQITQVKAAGFLTESILYVPGRTFVQVNASQNDVRQEGARKFIESMANRGIGFLSNPGVTREEQVAEFRGLLKDSFDMDTIGRFALGTYWRSASETQRDQYLKLFQKRVINSYAERFSEYSGQVLEVRDSRPEGRRDILVRSAILDNNGPEVSVDWRARYENGSYKVIDIVVEGVSMALTQRSDFASVIQRGGGDIGVLIAHLKE